VVLDMAPVAYNAKTDPHWAAVSDIIAVLNEHSLSLASSSSSSSSSSSTTDSLAFSQVKSRRYVDSQLRERIPDPTIRAFCMTNWDSLLGQWKIPLPTIMRNLPTLAAFDLENNGNEHDHINQDGDQGRRRVAKDRTFLQYTGDVLIIHGGKSRFVRASHLPVFSNYFPNHLVVTIRGAGHWLHAEAPDDTVALLIKYLSR
jgi:esterase